MRRVSLVRKISIKIAAAHADAVVELVECDKRCQYEVELSRRNYFALDGFPQSKITAAQNGFTLNLAVKHFSVFFGNRAENALFCAPRALDDAARIYFVGHREVTCNGMCGEKFVRPKNFGAYFCAGEITFFGCHRATCGERGFTQLRFQKKRLPPVPLKTVALEPEQQVGLAVTTKGIPLSQPCAYVADRT
jgi:hypothetical protein